MTEKVQTIDKTMAVRILNSRKIVKSPGEIKSVKVINVTEWEGKHIVNFQAMADDQAKKALIDFKAGKLQEAVNSNLSTSVLEGQFLPAKGQYVDLTIGYVPNRDKTGEVLRVIGMSPIKEASTDRFALKLEEEPSLDD